MAGTYPAGAGGQERIVTRPGALRTITIHDLRDAFCSIEKRLPEPQLRCQLSDKTIYTYIRSAPAMGNATYATSGR